MIYRSDDYGSSSSFPRCPPRDQAIRLRNPHGIVAPARTLRELHSLLESLEDTMEQDAIGEWLKTPNKGFHGASPMQVIERGDVAQVWRMIYLLGSGQPE